MSFRVPLMSCCLAACWLAACGVKPQLRYVAPDDTLHDVVFTTQSSRSEVRPAVTGDDPEVVADGPEGDGSRVARGPVRPRDVARAHYATAVGLQAGCHYDEALAHLRGYLTAEPDGEFAARALVRMGEIYGKPGYSAYDPEQARALLSEVTARYPGTAAAAVACGLLDDGCVGTDRPQGRSR